MWWCPSPLRLIVAKALRVPGDKGKEVVFLLIVVVEIDGIVIVLLIRPVSVTTNILMLSFLMASIIMSYVLIIVLPVRSVVGTRPALLLKFQLNGDILHDRRK